MNQELHRADNILWKYFPSIIKWNNKNKKYESQEELRENFIKIIREKVITSKK